MARKPYWSQRPRRVLARRAAAEVLARQQDRGALVARLVQHEVRDWAGASPGPAPARPGRGSATRRTGSGRSRSCWIDFRNCFGMIASVSTFSRSIGATRPVWMRERFHGMSLRRAGGRRRNGRATAAAAAIAGLTRWVRPPAPWRPSKLRLLVEAQRSPGSSRSAFIARHIEQPGSRHSKPAALKTSSQAFALGLLLHQAGARARPSPA